VFITLATGICLIDLQSISLVLVTLAEQMKLDPKRKCFRMVGGVLVERTVEDVVPNLQTNLEGVRRHTRSASL
jgi:hypothetical protein